MKLDVSVIGGYMNVDEKTEHSAQHHEMGSIPAPRELEEIMQRSEAILSELRRLQLKVTLVMGLLVIIVFGIWT